MDDKTLEDDADRTIGLSGGNSASCDRRGIGRRTALMGAGAVGLAGLLAACGDDEEPEQEPEEATTDEGAEPEPEPEEATTDEGAEPEPEETADEEPAVLTTTDEVPAGGGVILNGPGVVVTHPTEGEFAAFSTTCTHQGCAVTKVSDGRISCPCHGSEFSVVDGSVQQGPAERPLDEVAIVVQGNQILPG